MEKTIILKPRLSEKTYGLSQTKNVYVFDIAGDVNKHTAARAIETQFDVTVKAVNVINVKGKTKRTVRKGGRPANGKRSDIKKVYATLKEGQSIPVFAAIEEAEEKEEKTAKAIEKATEKAAKKEKK